MIRFSCPKCFKAHRVPDHLGGSMGRCGRCGHRFAVPGVAAVRPIGMPTFYPTPPSAAPRPRKPWPRPSRGGAIFSAVLVAVAVLWHFRAEAESLAGSAVDVIKPVLAVAIGVPLYLLYLSFATIPLWFPGYLSRRGKLSVGRWLIFALLFFFLFSGFGYLYEEAARHDRYYGSATSGGWSSGCLVTLMGVVGCLIAAGIHPKSP